MINERGNMDDAWPKIISNEYSVWLFGREPRVDDLAPGCGIDVGSCPIWTAADHYHEIGADGPATPDISRYMSAQQWKIGIQSTHFCVFLP